MSSCMLFSSVFFILIQVAIGNAAERALDMPIESNPSALSNGNDKHLDDHVHKLLDIAIDKLSSKVLIFTCARSDAPPLDCKTSDTMSVCYNNHDVVVMGIPLYYKDNDSELKNIVSWIHRCSVQNKTENAYIMQVIIDRLRQTPILYNTVSFTQWICGVLIIIILRMF